MRKALVFGAGNIGRGFLGVLLHESNYEVTFVDVDEQRVNLINQYRDYPVYICSKTGVTEQMVSGVRAIHGKDTEQVVRAVCDADVIMTAVGKLALQYVAKPIALGLIERDKRRLGTPAHVVVVACENVRDNTEYLASFVRNEVGSDWQLKLSRSVSFPNCIVDRIVPNTKPKSDHPLATTIEDYFQFVVDQSQLQEEFPHVNGVELVPHVSPKLDQKLFTLNMAHGIVGYYGILRGHHFVHEAISDREILELVMGALEEVEDVIVQNHPTISRDEQRAYAGKIVGRFQNHHLQDELVRVASQPKRKLSNNERLVRPACLLWEQGKIPAYLATGIASGFHFHDERDSQARELNAELTGRGIASVIAEVSGLPETHPVARAVKSDYLLRAL